MRRRFGSVPKPKKYSTPPPPIAIKTVSYNPAELFRAFEWTAVSVVIGYRLVVGWYAENTPALLVKQPLTADGQKAFDKAARCRIQSEGTSVEAEAEQGLRMAIRLYEKIWPMPDLPKLEGSSSPTLSPEVENVQTLLNVLNAAFKAFDVRFSVTFEADRSLRNGEVLLPLKELETLTLAPVLKTLLTEALTVAKVHSIVTIGGEQQMDGGRFMEALPKVLGAAYEYSAANNIKLKTVKAAKAPKEPKTPNVHTVASGVRSGGTPKGGPAWGPSAVIRLGNNWGQYPLFAKNSVNANRLRLVMDGMTIQEFKSACKRNNLPAWVDELRAAVRQGYATVA